MVYHNLNKYVLKQLRGVKNKEILDIGCGDGSLGKLLEKKGNKVMGIEIDDKSYEIAKRNINNIIHGDATKKILTINRNFDYAIMSDFIEHIPNPGEFLFNLRRVLKQKGKVVISTPNIAHFTTRFGLLFGKFNYQNHGILDKTHLTFFTKKSLKRLLKNSGYKICVYDNTPWIPAVLENTFFERISYFISRLWQGLFAYQFIIVAEKKL